MNQALSVCLVANNPFGQGLWVPACAGNHGTQVNALPLTP